MSKINFNVFIVMIAVSIGTLTIKTRPANAATHNLSGCVTILDDREYSDTEPSSTFDKYIPLVDVPIPVYIIDILGFNTHVGDLTTNSAGCFSGTVSGLGVPDDTTITVQMQLENSEYRVIDGAGTWLYELDKKTLSAGEDAEFGTIYGGSNNGAAMMWATAHDAVDFHDDRFGAGAWASHSYPLLTVLYPVEAPSNGNSDRIGITEGSRDNLNTFLHEFGHWIGMTDASSTGSLGSYCQNYTGSTYPYTEHPYTYIDPKMGSGDCSWHSTVYETEKHALSESHANLIRNVLWSGGCPSEYENVRFNTDGEHTVHSVGRALCDLIDSGRETAGALHSYGEVGNISTITLSENLLAAGQLSGSTAYGTDGTKIYSVDYTTGAIKEIVDMTSRGETVRLVSSDGTSLCAVTGRGGLYCGKTSGSFSMYKQTLPTGMIAKGIIVSGGKAYLSGQIASNTNKVYSGDVKNVAITTKTKKIVFPNISLENWKTVYSEPYTEDDSELKFVAVNAAKTKLFLARKHRVETCSLVTSITTTTSMTSPKSKTTTSSSTPFCGAGKTADFAGSRSYAGYRRSSPTDSYLDNITQIVIHKGGLYIVDTYGVAKLDLSSPTTLEQYIGAGVDNIFLNGLSRRSLKFIQGGSPFFAISGTNALFQPLAITGWDDQRRSSDTSLGMYLIDDSKTVHQEYHCGEENVKKSARDVVHAFVGNAYDVSLSDFLTTNMGLASGEASAVKNVSWAELKSCQSTDISGTEIIEDLTGSGTPTTTTSTTRTKKIDPDSVRCGDVPSDEQLPSAGVNKTATPFQSLVPEGTEELSVAPSYDTPTLLEKTH